MHTVFVVAVQAVFTPVAHVAADAQVVQGVVPAADQVDPATHAVGREMGPDVPVHFPVSGSTLSALGINLLQVEKVGAEFIVGFGA